MRLTDRGRVLCGAVATVAAVFLQQLVDGDDNPSAHASGPLRSQASAQVRQSTSPSTSRLPAPSVSSQPVSSHPTPAVSPKAGRTVAPPSAGPLPVFRGPGRLLRLPGIGTAGGSGPLRRYRVEVEEGIGEDAKAFAAAVQRTLVDVRSWGRDLSFQRVGSGPVAFTVILASPGTAEELCRPLEINYTLSCRSGAHSVINDARWRGGAASYAGNLAAYRLYVVNHEVGHALGNGHRDCAGPGRLAPVMMQQTKGIGACRPNPWPHP